MASASTAFLFPGQGSQSLGMMSDLAAARAEVRDTFEEASAAIDIDLWALTQDGPEAVLNRTMNTQPAMLAADIATWRVWRAIEGPLPAAMAGHSLGEYAALVAADAIDFPDAMRLVRRRGELMQNAVPVGEGAMAAIIGLDDEVVERLCAEAAEDEVVSCANYNAPGQVVIAGAAGAVARTSDAALEAGARRALKLPVSAPSHCPLMREAAQEFAAELDQADLRPPSIPIIHNADVGQHPQPDAIRTILRRQLWQPVRWTATIRFLVEQGYQRFAECGPGKVLTGLNRRISRSSEATALENLDALQALKQEMTT
jgi:[acyl-carrier-protein] S-malonyltransferase